ncbi:hypothetical protein NFHSH190041_05980 [Shewanella sp. NFH-SH190041]|uniref:hypothetical protein n=1 Tax=Shewanella sp. NFH-SH190041 TaxID=2950245 RepID=UPI0021C28DD1|nr:hypothetical protein [Shewanella sp. NFH-SH190041]BDM63146.1 hypothetical protein NFHSH190041_05980 [Shewanella sp. NFH-SH190041]
MSKVKQFVAGYLSRHKTGLILLLVAFVLGAYAAHWCSQTFFHENRYPLYQELDVIYGCAHAGNAVIAQNSDKERTRICACALHESQRHVDYRTYQNNYGVFNQYFGPALQRCAKDAGF